MRTSLKFLGLFSVAGVIGLVASCSATSDSGGVFSETSGAGGNPSGGTTNGAGGTGGQLGLGGFGQGGATSSGTGTSTCQAPPNDQDNDGDGFSEDQGDCNDCDPNTNPNAVEVGAPLGAGGGGGSYEAADENCDGQSDEPQVVCDQGLIVDDQNAMNAARAVDLCKQAAGPSDWGVIDAQWVMANGGPPPANANFHRGHGFVSGFGPNVTVRAGERMLAVSSGTARQPTDVGWASPGGFSKGYTGQHPQGFPKESAACPGVITGTPYDPTGVEIQVRVPSNAHGFSFNFDFYTYEWPVYICSQYNDFFVAILSPIPQGQMDGNISFDNQGNPISVNNAFMDVCGCTGGPPCTAGGKNFPCSLGNAELTGTGFEFDGFYYHAATSWLKTTAPAEPGTVISLRFAAYDSGDGVLDSTALVDNFQWIAEPGVPVGTTPDPPPEDPQ